MHLLPIVLATIFGFATSVPVNSADIKERIFNTAVTPHKKIAEFKKLIDNSDVSTRNSVIENLLNNVLDMVRDIIINGNDDLPILDPFVLKEIHLSGDLVGVPNSHVSLNDLTVTNLGTFEIDKLQVSTVSLLLQRFRIELDGRIPVLNVDTGNYDLSVNIFGGHIFGNGDMKLRMVNPRIYTNIVIALRLSVNGVFVEVRECNLRVNLDAFQAQITGLFGDEVTSQFVSNFLSSLVPELLEFFEEDITNTLNSAVLQIANDILKDLNLIDLLP